MTTKVWTFDLEDGKHTVELEHGYFSGKRVICVEGRPLEKSQKLFDTGSDHQLRIGSHTVTVHIGTNGVSYNYDLILDGRSLKTGAEVGPRVPIPAWAWIFIAGCALITGVAWAIFVIFLIVIGRLVTRP